MINASPSNGGPPSHPPSHFQPSVDPQQPWSYQCPDMRLDNPRRSMALPISNPPIASHFQVSQDQGYTSPHHLPFTRESGSRPQNVGVYGATPASYLSDCPQVVSATETASLYQPSYPLCSAPAPTFPSAGSSSYSYGDEQPTLLSWNNGTAQLGQARAAPIPAPAPPPLTSLPPQPFNSNPRILDHFYTAPATQARAMNVPNTNVTNRSHPYPSGRRTQVSSRMRGPRTRGLRTVPLVRIEDEVVWVRPHVLKVTMWLNWSPNADAQAHEPWDV